MNKYIDDLNARHSLEAEEAYKAGAGNLLIPTAWQGVAAPARRWVVEDWIPRGVVTALYGDGGVGKTLLGQQLLTCVGTGRSWCDLPTFHGRAFGVLCEDDTDELHRRQEGINRAYELAHSDLGDVRYWVRPGEHNLLMTFDGGELGMLTPWHAELDRVLTSFKPDILFLDTIADFYGANESDRSMVRQFVQNACGKLARKHDCAVVLAGHPSVAGMKDGTGFSGSTAWNNSVRSRLYLTRPAKEKDAEEEPDPNLRILSKMKANYAPREGSVHLEWFEGALLPHEAPEDSQRQLAWATIDAIFDEVQAAWDAGRPFSSAAQTRDSGRYLPEHMHTVHGVRLGRAKLYVRKWLYGGYLANDQASARKHLNGLRVEKRIEQNTR